MFPIKSCSINLEGILSTYSVHQGFFLTVDVTVLFHLIHSFQGNTVQTLTESLWGANCLVCKQ